MRPISDTFSRRLPLAIVCASLLSILCLTHGYAGNDFFGTNAGGSSSRTNNNDSDDSNPNAGLPGLNTAMPSNNAHQDFTDDEKRMQRKYKARIQNAKRNIEKGENMMKSAGNPNSPDYKKGKVFKEIGEKDLAELKANDPFGNSDGDNGSDEKAKDQTASSKASSK